MKEKIHCFFELLEFETCGSLNGRPKTLGVEDQRVLILLLLILKLTHRLGDCPN
jgi:hypothetical protein